MCTSTNDLALILSAPKSPNSSESHAAWHTSYFGRKTFPPFKLAAASWFAERLCWLGSTHTLRDTRRL